MSLPLTFVYSGSRTLIDPKLLLFLCIFPLLGMFFAPVPYVLSISELTNLAQCGIIYLLALDPLRRFPGPLAAKTSSWWLVYHSRLLRRSQAVSDAHKKYGKFFRISHNHISVSHPAAFKQVYSQKNAFLKAPFYDDKLLLRTLVEQRKAHGRNTLSPG
jgi:hypothetical protein